MAKVQKIKSRLTQISNVKYEKGLFKAHKTNTPLDGLFSIDGGVPKATNWMVVGDPGVGKSSVRHAKRMINDNGSFNVIQKNNTRRFSEAYNYLVHISSW